MKCFGAFFGIEHCIGGQILPVVAHPAVQADSQHMFFNNAFNPLKGFGVRQIEQRSREGSDLDQVILAAGVLDQVALLGGLLIQVLFDSKKGIYVAQKAYSPLVEVLNLFGEIGILVPGVLPVPHQLFSEGSNPLALPVLGPEPADLYPRLTGIFEFFFNLFTSALHSKPHSVIGPLGQRGLDTMNTVEPGGGRRKTLFNSYPDDRELPEMQLVVPL